MLMKVLYFLKTNSTRLWINGKTENFFLKHTIQRQKRLEGGYNPELEGAVTNDKGNIVYDENGKIKKEPTILQRGFELIKPLISPLTDQRSQTPLPPTSMPDKNMVASVPQINRQTGLTAGENAYLSNEEKAIKLRNKGMA